MRRLSAIALAALCLLPWAGEQEARAQSADSSAFSALALPFAPADPARRHMDIGGVWNGNDAGFVNADRIAFVLTTRPDLSEPARNVEITLALPNGVGLVGEGRIEPGNGCTGIEGGFFETDDAGGVKAAFVADANGTRTTSIPASCRLTLTAPIQAGASAEAGEHAATLAWSHAVDGAGPERATGSLGQTLLLRGGAPVMTVQPRAETAGVGAPLAWQVVVRNAGGGGLFDLSLNPANLGPGLRLVSVEPVLSGDSVGGAPANTGEQVGTDGRVTIPYLPAGQVRAFMVRATTDPSGGTAGAEPESCAGLVNRAVLSHRLDPRGVEAAAVAAFDISQPLVRFLQRPTDLLVGRGGAASGRFSVENAGDVAARAVAIETDFPASYDITVRSPNWTFEDGRFVYQGAGLDAGARDTIAFDVEPTGICPGMAALDIAWQPVYRNTCGASLRGQRVRARLSSDEQAPKLGMSLAPRLAQRDALSPRADDVWRTGRPAGLTLTLDGSNIDTDGDSVVTVTHSLPDLDGSGAGGPFGTLRNVRFAQRPVINGAEVACSGNCQGGDTITWSVPAQALRGAAGGQLQLDIDFDVIGNACLAGQRMNHSASAELSDASCPVRAGADFSAMLVNGAAGTGDVPGIQQEFKSSPGFFAAGLTHSGSEPGARAPAPEALRGDLIQHEARYVFPANAVGLWDTSRFADDFGAADLGIAPERIGQALAPGTLAFSLNGGPMQSFPVGAVFDARGDPCDPAEAGSCVGGLDIDLSFIAGPDYLDAPRVSGLDRLGSDLRIVYATIVPPSDLGDAVERRTFRKVTLSLADPAALGACVGQELGRSLFIHGDYNQLRRDGLDVALEMPESIAVCEAFPVSLDYSAIGSPSRLVAELLSRSGAAAVDDAASGYVVSRLRENEPLALRGSAAGGIAETTGDGRGLRITAADDGLVAQPGGISFAARRLPGTGDTEPLPLTTWLSHDDRARRATPAPDVVLRQQTLPLRVGRGDLKLSVVPGTLTVDADAPVRWWIKVSNLGDGPSVNTEVAAGIPNGLRVDETDLRAMADANAAGLASVDGTGAESSADGLLWNIGRLDPGQSLRLSVQASPAGICVAEGNQRATARASWGCGVPFIPAQTVSAAGPLLTYPAGTLQVDHVPTDRPCVLCGDGAAEIAVRNVGAASLTDVVVREFLDTATTGLSYRPGSTEISLDGGASYTPLGAAGDPEVEDGVLTWTAQQIPRLAELAPVAVAGGAADHSVRIRFGLRAGPAAYRAAEPTVQLLRAEACGRQICGSEERVASAEFAVDIAQPLLKLIKTGRNVSQGGPSGATVYGGKGDTIEWRVVVRNEGDAVARHIRLDDLLSASGGTARITEYAGPGSLALPIEIASKADFAQDLPDLPPGAFATLLIEEQLGGRCTGLGEQAPGFSFGCASVADSPDGRLNGIVEQGPVRLSMQPKFDGIDQSFRTEPDGRGWMTLSTRNRGGTASALVVQNHLPHGLVLDRSVPVEVAVRGAERYAAPPLVSGVRTRGEDHKPVFEFDGAAENDGKGRLRFGETLEVRFAVLPGKGFDTETAPFQSPEEAGTGDPERALGAEQNGAGLAFESTCGADADATGSLADIAPRFPDVDITMMDPAPRLLRDGESAQFSFAIANTGDEGSVASHVVTEVTAEPGFTMGSVILLRPDGSEVSCPFASDGLARCDARTMTPLVAGAEPTLLVVDGTARDNGAPLRLLATVMADLYDAAGADTGNDLSRDAIRPRLAGFALDKQVALTDQPDALSGVGTVLLGERVGWDVRARWFGLGQNERFSDIAVRQSFPDGEVAYVETPAQLLKGGRLGERPQPEGHGAATISVPDAVARDGETASADLALRLVGRVVGGASAVPGSARATPGDITFTANFSEPDAARVSETFTLSTEPDDPAQPTASQQVLRLRAPALRVVHGVANTAGQCGGGVPEETALGDAGDWLTYILSISNSAEGRDIDSLAPVFNAVAEVTIPDGLTPVAGSFQVLGDQAARHQVAPDPTNERVVRFAAVRPGSGDADGQTGAVGGGLARIEPGETVSMQFCAVIDDDVETGRGMVTDVAIEASALPPGVSVDEDLAARDAARLVADASAAVAVLPEGDNGRAIVAASVNAGQVAFPAAALPVVIGETVYLEATTVLPAGTARDLRITETVPPGLAILPGETTLVYGPGISNCALPGAGDPVRDGAQVQWSLGDCVVAAAATAEARRLTLRYGLQIVDIASNANGNTLSTSGVMSVQAGGVPVVFPFPIVGLTVREPEIALSVAAIPEGVDRDETVLTRLDAGDRLAVDVTLTSGEGVATAHDLWIAHRLPVGLTYVPGSMAGDLLTEPELVDGMLVWGPTQPETAAPATRVPALSPGSRLSFSYRLQVADSVIPGLALPSLLGVSWSSLPGVVDGERVGQPLTPDQTLASQTGLGTARAALEAAVKDQNTVVKRRLRPAPEQGGTVRIGERIQIGLELKLQEGLFPSLDLRDTLAPGLIFERLVSMTSASAPDGPRFEIEAAPRPGQSGEIVWRFKDVTNPGDGFPGNDTIGLVYEARLLDDPGILPPPPIGMRMRVPGTSASLAYETAAGPRQIVATAIDEFRVGQPVLSMKQTRVTTARRGTVGFGAGDRISYSARIRNTGTAPAHGVVFRVELPPGMRAADPREVGLSVALMDGRTIDLSEGRDYEARFDAEQGVFQVRLVGVDAGYIDPGETLGIDYAVLIDAETGPQATLTLVSRLETYSSMPGSAGDQGRVYAGTGAFEESYTTPSPRDLSQTVLVNDQARPGNPVAIGDAVTFRLNIPATPIPSALYDVAVRNWLPEGMRLLRVEGNEQTLRELPDIPSPPDPKDRGGRLAGETGTADAPIEFVIDSIPAGVRAAIDVVAVVENRITSTTASTMDNRAAFRWASRPGGETNDWIEVAEPVTVTVTEPVVAINKSALPAYGVDAGDIVTYTVRVENVGTEVGAYDIDLKDKLPAGVRYVPGSFGSFAGPTLDEPVIEVIDGVQHLRWINDAEGPDNVDLAPLERIEFVYKAVVGQDVTPGQNLGTGISATWTSTDGPNPDERDGSGTPNWNDYAAIDPGPVAIRKALPAQVVVRGLEGEGQALRVGEIVSFDVTLNLIEGRYDDLEIEAELPDGLAYVDSRLDPPAISGGPRFSLPDADAMPLSDAAGIVLWKIGAVENPGDNDRANDQLRLSFRTRVVNDEALTPLPRTPGQAMDKRVTLRVRHKAASPDDPPVETELAKPRISIGQPMLRIAKAVARDSVVQRQDGTGANLVSATETVRKRLVIENVGTAPAYGVVVEEVLPDGMRSYNPVLVPSATRLGDQPVDLAQIDGRHAVDGIVSWILPDTRALPPGGQLTITYETRLDDMIGGGLTLASQARVVSYASLPETAAAAVAADGDVSAFRRVYGETAAAVADLRTPAPRDAALEVLVNSQPGLATAAIGDQIAYRMLVPSTPVPVVLYDVEIENRVPEGIVAAFDDVVASTTSRFGRPRNGSVTHEDNRLLIRFPIIPAGEQAIIELPGRLANTLTLGNKDRPGRTNRIVNDSLNFRWASRPIGAGGRSRPATAISAPPGVDVPGVYAPPVALEITEPELVVSQALVDVSGAVQADDRVAQRITIRNVGNAVAHDVVLDLISGDGLALATARRDPEAPSGAATLGGSRETLEDGRSLTRWRLGSIPAGGETVIAVDKTVTLSVEPFQQLQTETKLSWSSQAGDREGARRGLPDSEVDDYRRSSVSPSVSVAAPEFAISERAPTPDAAAPGAYQVGQPVVYDMVLRPSRGSMRAVRLLSELPEGLRLRGAEVEPRGVSRPGGARIEPRLLEREAEEEGAPRSVTVDLGDLIASGPDAELRVRLLATVADIPSNGPGTALRHAAKLLFAAPPRGTAPGAPLADASDRQGDAELSIAAPEAVTVGLVSPGPLSVTQRIVEEATPPRGEDNLYFAGDTQRFIVTVRNPGRGTAHDVAVGVQLPPEMRRTKPRLVSATLNGAPTAPGEDDGRFGRDGTIVWSFASGTQALASGDTLSLTFDAKLSLSTGAGRALSVRARVEAYHSASDAHAGDRRAFAPSPPAVTRLRTPRPEGMGIVQIVDDTVDRESANIGALVQYGLVVPAEPVRAALYDVTITNLLPDGFSVADVRVNKDALSNAGRLRVVGEGVPEDGKTVTLRIGEIPPGEQAQVLISGRLANDARVVAGRTIENAARYAWAGERSGPAEPEIVSETRALRVTEPVLRVAADLAEVQADPVEAGDRLRYALSLRNTGDGPAHDIAVRLRASEGLRLHAVVPGPDDPGEAAVERSFGGDDTSTVYLWTIPGPLPPGGVYSFETDLMVDGRAEATARLTGATAVSWTSAAGPVAGERHGGGDGGFNNYAAATGTVSAQVAGPALSLTLAPRSAAETQGATDTPADAVPGAIRSGGAAPMVRTVDRYHVGDVATYLLRLQLPASTLRSVQVEQQLSWGLEFAGLEVEAAALGHVDGAPISLESLRSVPEPEATGLLRFDIGDVRALGDAPELRLIVKTRVRDLETVQAGVTMDGQARLSFANPNGATGAEPRVTVQAPPNQAAQVAISEPLPMAVDVQPMSEPSLGLDADGRGLYRAGDKLRLRVTARNDGAAPAHNLVVRALLPEGMRAASPRIVAANLAGRPITLEADAAGFVNSGVALWRTRDQDPLQAGQTLTIDFEAVLDPTVGGGLVLPVTGGVTAFYSLPSANPNERRAYRSDLEGRFEIATPRPEGIAVAHYVDGTLGADRVNIGSTVRYVLTVPETPVGVALFDVDLQARLPKTYRVVSIDTNADTLDAGRRIAAETRSPTRQGNAGARIAEIPAGKQAIVTIEAMLENLPQVRQGETLDVSASYRWAASPGGDDSARIVQAAPLVLTVAEPLLEIGINGRRALPEKPLLAGDFIDYRVVMRNVGAGAAHDVVVRLLTSPDLVFASLTADSVNPGAARNAGLVGQERDWQWLIPELPAGSEASFTARFRVADSTGPNADLTARAQTLWTSAPGSVPNERNGTSGQDLDNYQAITQTVRFQSAEQNSVRLAVGGATLPAGAGGTIGFRIGDYVEYTLHTTLQEGTLEDVIIQDVLPRGMAFEDFVAVTPPAGSGGFQYSTPVGEAAPQAGARGLIRWNLGRVVNAADGRPDNDTLTLVYRARIVDDPNAIPVGATEVALRNAVGVRYRDGQGKERATEIVSESVLVRQPQLTLALDGPDVPRLDASRASAFQFRVENVGLAPAFVPRVLIALPEGMRDLDPRTVRLAIENGGAASRALSPSQDFEAVVDRSGALRVAVLQDTLIAPGGTMTGQFSLRPRADLPDGKALRITGRIVSYGSRAANAVPRREVRLSETDGSTGTPNAGRADDHADDHGFIVSAPLLTVTKDVRDLNGESVRPGDRLRYTVTIANLGTGAVSDAVFLDEMPAGFQPGTLELVSFLPRSGTISADASAGPAGTGVLHVSGLSIPPGRGLPEPSEPSLVTLTYEVVTQPVLSHGAVIGSHAKLVLPGVPDPVLSDSGNVANDNRIEEGNARNDPNDDDPTTVVIHASPDLTASLSVTDLAGGGVAPGDRLTYAVEIQNSGSEPAVDARLFVPIPGLTRYVAGSTRVNGQPARDLADGRPLFASPDGLRVASTGSSDGSIGVGAPATVSFQVDVARDVLAGARISTQAHVLARGAGSGAYPLVRSDDPNRPGRFDPAIVSVGGEPDLSLRLTAADATGGSVLPGRDRLRYRASITNHGAGEASGVVFGLPIPTGTTLVTDSIMLDPDGPGPAPAVRQRAPLADLPGNELRVPVGTVAPGDAATLSVSLDVTQEAKGSIATQAWLRADGLQNVFSAPEDGAGGMAAPTVVAIDSLPLLHASQTVTALGGRVLPGQTLEYVIVIANAAHATDAARNLQVWAPLPELAGNGAGRVTLRYVPNTLEIDGNPVGGAQWPLRTGVALERLVAGLGTLEPGQTRTLRYHVSLSDQLAAGGGASVTSQARISHEGGTLLTDSDRNDGLEAGNDAGNPNDDDPTVVRIGGATGIGGGTASIDGQLYVDENGNYRVDTTEPRLRGWKVELVRDGQVVHSTVSDGDGRYGFRGILPGSGYLVRIRHPETRTVFSALSPDGQGSRPGRLLDGDHFGPIAVPLEATGVVYNVVTRATVPGARLQLLYNGVPVPESNLRAGQQGQTTGSDGMYRFDLVGPRPSATGTAFYSIAVVPPDGFAANFPSGLMPPEPFPFDAEAGPGPGHKMWPNLFPPAGDAAVPYYLSLILNPGDRTVLNNHIPLDPLSGVLIELTKTAPDAPVRRNEMVSVALTARNLTSKPITQAVREVLPTGFDYLPGSATIAGVSVEPVQTGRTLTWRPVTFAPGRGLELRYMAVPSRIDRDGVYESQAFVIDLQQNRRLSNLAVAQHKVSESATAVCGPITGRVFDDRNADGVSNDNEPGLVGVRIVVAGSTSVITDNRGRYSVGCGLLPPSARGDRVALELDLRSLPAGFNVTGSNPMFAAWPGQGGEIVPFPVTRQRVVRLDLADGAFEQNRVDLRRRWQRSLDKLLTILGQGQSLLRLTYRKGGEPVDLVNRRVETVIDEIRRRWNDQGGDYPLRIEQQIIDRKDLARRAG